MTAKRSPGRPATDGATKVDCRVNVMLTKEHRDRLAELAAGGVSAWVRSAIDAAWAELQKKGN